MTFHVMYERDEAGLWVASVREVRGCHTQGRTVDEARRRIREALTLFVPNAKRVVVRDQVNLPAKAINAVKRYTSQRKRANVEERRAANAALRAVRTLQGGRLRLSTRDAANVLGMSHQRVHQLAALKHSGRRRRSD